MHIGVAQGQGAWQPRHMTTPFVPYPGSGMNRRDTFKTALAAAGGTAFANAPIAHAAPDARKASPKRFKMKKSINLWAFPYPDRMSLKECLQLAKDAGFDGIELNYDLESDLSPKSGPKEFAAIRREAERIGIAIKQRLNLASVSPP